MKKEQEKELIFLSKSEKKEKFSCLCGFYENPRQTNKCPECDTLWVISDSIKQIQTDMGEMKTQMSQINRAVKKLQPKKKLTRESPELRNGHMTLSSNNSKSKDRKKAKLKLTSSNGGIMEKACKEEEEEEDIDTTVMETEISQQMKDLRNSVNMIQKQTEETLSSANVKINLLAQSLITNQPKQKPPLNLATKDIEQISIHKICENGEIDILLRLLAMGVDVNQRDQFRKTPLMYAAKKGKEHVVETLIQHKADVNAFDNFGDTALHFGCISGSVPTVNLLLRNKANVSALNKYNWTPLHTAQEEKRPKIVEILNQKLLEKPLISL